jgi:SNF2 family DNA or RNA helicase
MMELLVAVKGRSDGKEKTIVFSQFTSFLNLLEPFLKEEGIGYVRCRSYVPD